MGTRMPTGMYGKFERKDYTFEAFMPKSKDEECEFLVKVSEHGHSLFQFHIPLSYLGSFKKQLGLYFMILSMLFFKVRRCSGSIHNNQKINLEIVNVRQALPHLSFIKNGKLGGDVALYIHNLVFQVMDVKALTMSCMGNEANGPWCRKEITLGKSPSYFFTITYLCTALILAMYLCWEM